MSPRQWQLSQRAKLCELAPVRKVVVELWLLGIPDWCKVLANIFDAAKIVVQICHCPGGCLGVEHGWNSLWICILWISTSAVNSIQILSACSGHRRKDRQDPEWKRWGGKKQTGGNGCWILKFSLILSCIAQHQEEKQKYSANSSRNVDQILSQIDDTSVTVFQRDLDGYTLHYKESVITMQVNVNFHGNYNNKAMWGTIFHAAKVPGYFTIQNNLKQCQTTFSVFDLKSAMKTGFCISKNDKQCGFREKTFAIQPLTPLVTWTLLLVYLSACKYCWMDLLPSVTEHQPSLRQELYSTEQLLNGT